MGHIDGLHDLVGPLPVNVVLLVDLEPACAYSRGRYRAAYGPVQHVCDGARVRRGVPLHFDRVAGLRGHRRDARALGPAHVTDYVVARHVRLYRRCRGQNRVELVLRNSLGEE